MTRNRREAKCLLMEVTTLVTIRINYHMKNRPASSTETGSNINHAISE